MKLSSKPVINPVVVLREEFDDWAVLFNPDTANAVGTNPVGVALWKLMDGNRNIEELVDEIKHRFSDVPDSAIDDLTVFVNNLAENGFVGFEIEKTN